jgi:hypothetical protein
MKHQASRDFFDYWDRQRGMATAPDRYRIEPGAVRHVLADSFVLACGTDNGCPFRAAGTRLCALFGRELIDTPFLELWDAKSRDPIADLLAAAALEMRPAVAGVAAVNDAGFLNLELLLLPFALKPHTPHRLTGLLVPLAPPLPGHYLRRTLNLTSWRDLDAAAHRRRWEPRMLRRWNLGSGFTLYEGRNRNA